MQFFQGQPVKVEEAEVGWPRGEGEREGGGGGGWREERERRRGGRGAVATLLNVPAEVREEM